MGQSFNRTNDGPVQRDLHVSLGLSDVIHFTSHCMQGQVVLIELYTRKHTLLSQSYLDTTT